MGGVREDERGVQAGRGIVCGCIGGIGGGRGQRGRRRGVDRLIVEKLEHEGEVDHAEVSREVGLGVSKVYKRGRRWEGGGRQETYLEGQLVGQDATYEIGDIAWWSVSVFVCAVRLGLCCRALPVQSVSVCADTAVGGIHTSNVTKRAVHATRSLTCTPRTWHSPNNQLIRNGRARPSHDLSVAFLTTCGSCAHNQNAMVKYPKTSATAIREIIAREGGEARTR